MERRRLERAAAEKARVEAAAATAELEGTRRPGSRRAGDGPSDRGRGGPKPSRKPERRAAPWRESRARGAKGVTWSTTPKPIFVSYAPTPDATFAELAYCKKIAETLDDARTVALPGESRGERVRLAWLDASELGTLVTSTDERALARLEACESCAGVVAIVTPAYVASEQCATERDAVRIRRRAVSSAGKVTRCPSSPSWSNNTPRRRSWGPSEGRRRSATEKRPVWVSTLIRRLCHEGLLGAGDPPPIVVPREYDPTVAAELR